MFIVTCRKGALDKVYTTGDRGDANRIMLEEINSGIWGSVGLVADRGDWFEELGCWISDEPHKCFGIPSMENEQ